MSEQYDGSLDRADKWGCVASLIVGLPLFAFLLLMDALGDCAPDVTCQKGFLRMVLAPTLIVAGVVWLGVRHLIRRKPGSS